MKYFKRKYSMIEKYRQANSISPGSKVREEEKKVVNPVRSMFWFYLIIIKKKSITLSCTQILILHKLFPPRASISYLLETCHSYKFQCQFLTNKSAFYSMGLCSAWLKILWKLPQVFFLYPYGLLTESGCPHFLTYYNLLVKLLPRRTPEVVAFKWLLKWLIFI